VRAQKESGGIVADKKQTLASAEEFLRELGRGLPEDERIMAGYAEEATVQTDATGKKLNAGWWPVPYKEGKYINANANCYVCISSSIKTPNPKTQEMRYWRGEASFGHGMALMVDDIGNGKGSKGGLDLLHFYEILKPTAVVETSPGNFQLWYFLDAPESHMIRFKAFLTCFVTHVLKKGGDSTIKDISRYGRMPIGINNKRHGPNNEYKYPVIDERGKTVPYQVEIRDANYERRYSIEGIAHAFGFEIVMPVKREIEVNEDEYKYDVVWLRMAEKILSATGMGEGTGGEVVLNMSGKYRIRCPWGDQHSNGDPYGAYFRGPIPGADVEFVFGCGHDGCRKMHKRTWAAFVDEIVMTKIVADLETINRQYAS
jgi:hypothetical protein